MPSAGYDCGMKRDFSGIFHRSAKDISGGGEVFIPKDDREWPEEWKHVAYKTYPRLPKIKLPEAAPHGDIAELIATRRSSRKLSGDPLSLSACSALLKYAAGETDEDGLHRAQPSGGTRYPIELYPLVFRGGEIPSGVYHYNVKDHALDVLAERSFSQSDIASLTSYEWVQNASALLVMTAVFGRNQIKYGDRGYRYVLFEAGHIGQNAYLVSRALGLKCCSLTGFKDRLLEGILDIDGITESALYAIAIG